jgi:hypothetical protein
LDEKLRGLQQGDERNDWLEKKKSEYREIKAVSHGIILFPALSASTQEILP